MNRRVYPFVALIFLMLAALACALPGGAQPSSPNQVETIVAATIQALTPVSGTEPTSAPNTEAPSVLPHSFYYLGTDSSGLMQIFRIEKDGKTQKQITSETVNVGNYDVSPLDGSVAYVVNNQLLSINADGSNRSLLFDGGTPDPNNQLATTITSPVFSPNGQTIAYGFKGLNLYSITGGTSNLVLPQKAAGDSSPAEMYFPQNYSPDGSKILITIAIPNSDGISSGVFYPGPNTIVRFTGGDGARICCEKQGWAADGSALFIGNASLGFLGSGLWRIDAATGTTTTLIPTDAGSGNYNFADMPYPAPDGQLYYFYATASAGPDGMILRAPLQIVRSAPDGVTGRAVLNPGNFQLMNEALWAPDASFVVIAFAPTQDVYNGGQAEVTYLDGRPSMVLTTYAQNMKWGP
ncbi:MAG: hypothetical protein QM730_01020 [Anaerolineales bacterium]